MLAPSVTLVTMVMVKRPPPFPFRDRRDRRGVRQGAGALPDPVQIQVGTPCQDVRTYVLAMNGINAASTKGATPPQTLPGASWGPNSTLRMPTWPAFLGTPGGFGRGMGAGALHPSAAGRGDRCAGSAAHRSRPKRGLQQTSSTTANLEGGSSGVRPASRRGVRDCAGRIYVNMRRVVSQADKWNGPAGRPRLCSIAR